MSLAWWGGSLTCLLSVLRDPWQVTSWCVCLIYNYYTLKLTLFGFWFEIKKVTPNSDSENGVCFIKKESAPGLDAQGLLKEALGNVPTWFEIAELELSHVLGTCSCRANKLCPWQEFVTFSFVQMIQTSQKVKQRVVPLKRTLKQQKVTQPSRRHVLEDGAVYVPNKDGLVVKAPSRPKGIYA